MTDIFPSIGEQIESPDTDDGEWTHAALQLPNGDLCVHEEGNVDGWLQGPPREVRQ